MRRFLVLLMVLPLTGRTAQAQPKEKKTEGIDPATVGAYEKVGAAYWDVVKDRFGCLEFKKGKQAAKKGLPGFRFSYLLDGKLPRLPPVSVHFALELGFTEVTDAGLKHLAGLKNLSSLHLTSTKVTDAGLKHLTTLNNLSSLDLSHTQVTDAGLKHLTGLKNLSYLELCFTQVTDAGLKPLAGLKNLSSLHLAGTKVTDAGLKDLYFTRRRVTHSRRSGS
jgi:hypothetical protein